MRLPNAAHETRPWRIREIAPDFTVEDVGLLGKGYMALIAPFRHWVVYPALLRQIERAWLARR